MSLEIDRSWRSMFVGLLAPDTCADLIDHLAARRRFRAAAALVPSGLYSLDEFEATLASASTPSSHIRLARRGRPLSPLLYCRDVGGGIQTEAVLRLREQGVSIVINRLHELTPSVAAAVSALRARLGAEVLVQAYFTPAGIPAFARHFDDHDVLVFQVAGAKHWCSYGPAAHDDPPTLDDGDPRSPEWEADLWPGDILFMPRRELHGARPISTPSLHVSIGMRLDKSTI